MYKEEWKEKNMSEKNILITGCMGFIGTSLIIKLLKDSDYSIIGIDNMNDYYDVRLKEYRAEQIENNNLNRFVFVKGDISDKKLVEEIFEQFKPQIVINLAAQAGVRYSIVNPDVYIQSNIVGFFNVLEACRHNNSLQHFIFASSSSVYGNNKKIPYSTNDKTDEPVSLYAATKKADEVMAFSYAKLYGIPITGLRFFTVYGPMGRPDMAYYSFAEKLINNKKIELYNNGKNKRDFTYIGDVVNSLINIIKKVPEEDLDGIQYKIFNIGNKHPVETIELVSTLSKLLVKYELLDSNFNLENYVEFVTKQAGDVDITYADVEELEKEINYSPNTDLAYGLEEFVKWFKNYKRLMK